MTGRVQLCCTFAQRRQEIEPRWCSLDRGHEDECVWEDTIDERDERIARLVMAEQQDVVDDLLSSGYQAEINLQPSGYNGTNHGFLWGAKAFGPWTACNHIGYSDSLAEALRLLREGLRACGHDTIHSQAAAKVWEAAHGGRSTWNIHYPPDGSTS